MCVSRLARLSRTTCTLNAPGTLMRLQLSRAPPPTPPEPIHCQLRCPPCLPVPPLPTGFPASRLTAGRFTASQPACRLACRATTYLIM